MEEDWVRDSAMKLGSRHYLKSEVELFFLQIGQIQIHESIEKKNATVAYFKAIQSWVNSKLGTKERLIEILKSPLEWYAVANEIIGIPVKPNSKIIWSVLNKDKKFIGRERELEKIEEHLNEKDEVVITAMVGLGGIGKTTVTAAYVWKNVDKFKTIVWFNSEGNSLKDEYLRFGVERHLTTEDNTDIRKVKNWFEENTEWLIIFDNVDNEKSLRDFIPNRGGKIIVTSRNQFWNDIENKIELEKYSLPEVKSYLAKCLKAQYEETIEELGGEEIILKFATDLDYHPLAITHAVSYITNNKNSIEGYLKYKEEQSEIILSNFTPNQIRDNDFLKIYITVFESFMLSVKKISLIKEEGLEAIKCLNKCAFIVPEKIPRRLFSNEALMHLAQYSLITFTDCKYLSIHRLVQESIRLTMASNSTVSIDDKIYPSISTIENELILTYNLFDKFYPIGRCKKEDVLFKRDLLPHYGSLFSYHLKYYNTNITPEQTKKLTQIELDEVAESFEKFKVAFSNPGSFEIFENNIVTSAKFSIKSALDKIDKINKEEFLEVLYSCLQIFEKELILDDETIGETYLYLSFYYINEYLKNKGNQDFLNYATEYQTLALKGKFDQAQIPYTHLLECSGYLRGNENNKKVQLELYMESYRRQMDFLQRDFLEAMPLIKWEKHQNLMSLEGAVSAGRFNFPGFEFYRGKGFLNEAYELEIFVGRGNVDGNIIPGKFIRFPSGTKYPEKRFDSFQCSYKGQEVKTESYEILRMKPGTYKWVLSSNGEEVKKAIPGGFENGQELFIGRVYVVVNEPKKIPTEPSVGKINRSFQGCIVPLWNKEYIFKEYEILVGVSGN